MAFCRNIVSAFCVVVLATVATAQQADEATALNTQSLKLFNEGKYSEAIPLAQRALAMREKALGPDHPDVAVSLNNLATLYNAQDRYAEAEPLFKRALAIHEKAQGPDHPDVGTSLANLAALYQDEGRYAEAEPLFRRGLAIREKALGPDHLEVAHSLNGLALLAEALGRYTEAEPLFKRALAIREQHGANTVEVAQSLNYLGELYRAQGRYADAEPLYKRSLSINEKTLGSDSLAVGVSLTDLALLYGDESRYADAEPLFKQSLAIREKALGSDHRLVAESLNYFADLYRTQGRYADAEPLFKRSIRIYEQALGLDHPDVAHPLDGLASLYETLSRYADAEPLYKRSLAINEKAFGPDHPEVATSLNDLAELYRVQGRNADAEPLYKRALAIRERALGPDHPDVGVSLNNMALLYKAQARYADAEQLLKRCLAIDGKTRGPDSLVLARSLNNLAVLYNDQGRYEEAEPIFQHSLAIREKALGPDHPDVGKVLNNLAFLYRIQGRFDDAELLFKRSLAIDEKALGPDNLEVASSLNHLAGLYQTQGRYEDAEPLYERSLAIREKAFGLNNPSVALQLVDLAALYEVQGRYDDAEALYKRTLDIYEKALGPDHPSVAISLDGLATLYEDQGRYADAEPLFKRSLIIDEKAFGLDHPAVVAALNNLAVFYFRQSDWNQASDYWRRSTNVMMRRVERGTAGMGKPLTGRGKSEAEQSYFEFQGLARAAYRTQVENGRADLNPQLIRETFQIAQWVQGSEAAASLAQMAARGAKGDPALASIVRERQDLVAEWQKRDGARAAQVAQPDDKRDKAIEAANAARMTEIDARIAEIDKRLTKEFSDYAALASPNSLSVEQVQTNLAADEALVLLLDLPEAPPTPEETFIWVVTKTNVRWVRSEIGSVSLNRLVAALRCGLDFDGSWGAPGSRCADLLGVVYSEGDHDAGKPLPFDINRAHALYNALFGPIEDVIKDKHLLLVPSGALTSLPFQVLITALPGNASSGQRMREAGLLGAELQLSEHEVSVVHTVAGGPAETSGLKPRDILLSIAGREIVGVDQAIDAVRACAPRTTIQLRIRRDGEERDVSVTLGSTTIRDWAPHFLEPTAKNVAWLIREHALSVLPSVSSLGALRQLAKDSHASHILIGFGNPLLDGEPDEYPDDGPRAAQARAHERCAKPIGQQVASLEGKRRGTRSPVLRGGLADVEQIRFQAPLPETADELCAVARDLDVGDEDVRLGARATEAEVKRLSEAGELSKYRLIHFATHGALAGQVSGNSEPGLLLTPPDKATDTDDGYLSASEIAGLKLDADWVILSACNTAGGAEGAEALSGLARAFFYAGARALLVSHWSVYSDTTVKLITGAISRLAADSSIGRAEAMRRSMLALIDQGATRESHPAFWAPFIVVGEGAARSQ
jgi:tetratricopeptide (TPR) repeat protein/CHAT domain-containing protein